MRIVGSTGNIGALTVATLERAGHDVVPISRSLGVDLSTGEGLDAALTGVEAVVDGMSYEDSRLRPRTWPMSSPRSPRAGRRGVTATSPARSCRTWWTWPGVPTTRGHAVKLVPTWSSVLGAEMAGDVLLPFSSLR